MGCEGLSGAYCDDISRKFGHDLASGGDGIVWREKPGAPYTQTNATVPEYRPRDRQKGASASLVSRSLSLSRYPLWRYCVAAKQNEIATMSSAEAAAALGVLVATEPDRVTL